MAIRISTEKIVFRGQKARKITGIGGVIASEKLPFEYVEGYPRVVWTSCWGGGIEIYDEGGDYMRLLLDEIYTETEFQICLKWIEKAGERLSRIRQKEKELKETWKGEETFII